MLEVKTNDRFGHLELRWTDHKVGADLVNKNKLKDELKEAFGKYTVNEKTGEVTNHSPKLRYFKLGSCFYVRSGDLEVDTFMADFTKEHGTVVQ